MAAVVEVGDWYYADAHGWTLDLRLRHGAPATAFIPAVTAWHVLVDEEYPWGEVRFLPALVDGVVRTHAHQRFNDGRRAATARAGQICLTRPARDVGRAGDEETYDASTRLVWYVTRAVDWLNDAVADRLVLPGEPFELPDYPGAETSRETFAFMESPASLARWAAAPPCGVAHLRTRGPLTLVHKFALTQATFVSELEWHAVGRLAAGTDHGVWVRLPEPPVDRPWHPPARWGELVALVARTGRDLNAEVSDTATRQQHELRDGQSHLLVLGFPVPRLQGGGHERMHWQALRLPPLADRRTKGGFRPGKEGFRAADRATALRDGEPLRWICSQNWADDCLTSRGALPADVTCGRILVIGAGSLGACVSEALVRGGARDLVVIDRDTFAAGNATRHVLTLANLGDFKAVALARRLELVSPAARIEPLPERFPPSSRSALLTIQSADLILDTTGSDAVASSVATLTWKDNARLVSLSFGYAAHRLFVYSSLAAAFSVDAFHHALAPWLHLERYEPADPFPLEGIGCWHPVFPARADDVWLLAAAGVKAIGDATRDFATKLRVFEQLADGATFLGLREVSLEAQ
jgi:hypothetical protein